jgi:hypothetical protein
MSSITPKRSAATLGVVMAALLVAVAPASAQIGPGTMGVKAPGPSANVPAQISIGTAEVFELNTFGGNDTLRAGSSEVLMESFTLARGPAKDTFDGGGLTHKELAGKAVLDTGMLEHEWLKAPTTAGTRIGSAGVMAQTRIEWPQVDYNGDPHFQRRAFGGVVGVINDLLDA